MDWLQNNWIWIALAVGFFALHRVGGCGHHSGHGRRETSSSSDGGRAPAADAAVDNGTQWEAHAHSAVSVPAVGGPAEAKPHRHGC